MHRCLEGLTLRDELLVLCLELERLPMQLRRMHVSRALGERALGKVDADTPPRHQHDDEREDAAQQDGGAEIALSHSAACGALGEQIPFHRGDPCAQLPGAGDQSVFVIGGVPPRRGTSGPASALVVRRDELGEFAEALGAETAQRIQTLLLRHVVTRELSDHADGGSHSFRRALVTDALLRQSRQHVASRLRTRLHQEPVDGTERLQHAVRVVDPGRCTRQVHHPRSRVQR
ncbi:MAG: hypothetical protein M3Z10_15170 [Gemmatimonadota bacterium]|nr:hypothetical protein [Gemmatimonadota bacterium]